MKRFYFLLPKNFFFFSFHAFLKKYEAQTIFYPASYKIISFLFYFLALTTMQSYQDYYHQRLNLQVASGASKQL